MHVVEDVVERGREPVDVLVVDRRDEHRIQALQDQVGDLVAFVLELLDAAGLRGDVFVLGDQVRGASARLPRCCSPGGRGARRSSRRAEPGGTATGASSSSSDLLGSEDAYPAAAADNPVSVDELVAEAPHREEVGGVVGSSSNLRRRRFTWTSSVRVSPRSSRRTHTSSIRKSWSAGAPCAAGRPRAARIPSAGEPPAGLDDHLVLRNVHPRGPAHEDLRRRMAAGARTLRRLARTREISCIENGFVT